MININKYTDSTNSHNTNSTRRVSAFSLTHTAMAVCVALTLGASQSAFAQQEQSEQESETEVIQVRGIKGALINAQDLKRNASTIVDSITAEDIGEYTDDNLAESLQRLAGVQISRADNGEGQYVSIRGLGPQFVRTTLNGRSIFGGAGGDSGVTAVRAYALDGLSPEMTAGTQVYKSAMAKIPEGGIGGNVNVLTARPLDLRVPDKKYEDGLYVAINADATYAVEAEAIDPRTNLFVSYKANEKFGILANFSYNDKSTLTQKSQIVNSQRNLPINDIPNVLRPINHWYFIDEGSVERQGFSVTAQWRPTEEWNLVADVMLNSWLTERNQNTLQSTYKGGPAEVYTNAEVRLTPDLDLLGGVLESSDAIGNGARFNPVYTSFERDEKVFGFNAEWTPSNSALSAVFDIAYTDADFVRKNDIAVTELNNYNGVRFNVDRGDGLGIFEFLPSDEGVPFDQNNATIRKLLNLGFNRLFVAGDEMQYRAEFTYKLDNEFISSIEAGASYRDKKLDHIFNVFRYGGGPATQLFGGPQGDILAQNGLTADDVPMINVVQAPTPNGGFLSETNVPYDTFATFDVAQVIDFWRPLIENSTRAPNITNIDAREYATTGNVGPNTFWETNEKITTAYVMANLNMELGADTILRGNIGARFVKSDIAASGFNTTSIGQIEGINIVPGRDLKTFETTENDVLPSMNLIIDTSNDLVFRFAASKVIARPEPFQLAGPSTTQFRANEESPESLRTISVNKKNEELDPFEANQFDLIAEWYPEDGKGSFVAAGYFLKDIKSLVSNSNTNPDEITIDGETFRVGEGDLERITIVQPVNDAGEGATVSGIELQGHLPFDVFTDADILSDMGINATYTKILKNETDVLDPITGEKLPFQGASEDNYSFVLYYDDGKLSMRSSYTYRSDYFRNNGFFGAGIYADEYASLDANITYRFTKNFSVRVQARNLLEESARTFVGKDSLLPNIYAQNGRSYVFGVRYGF